MITTEPRPAAHYPCPHTAITPITSFINHTTPRRNRHRPPTPDGTMRRRGIHEQRQARNTPRTADAKPHPRPTPQNERRNSRDERINPPPHKSRIAIPDDNDDKNDTGKTDDNANNITTRRHDEQTNAPPPQTAPPRRRTARDARHETIRRDDETPRDDTTRHRASTPKTRR